MKKQYLVLIFVTILALLAQGCNMPAQYGEPMPEEHPEEFRPDEQPPEGFQPEEHPEEFPGEEHPPEEMPGEEHPPEDFGEAQIAFFEANPPNIRAGECAVVEWGVEGQADVTLNGEVVDQHGAREVCLSNTTSYHLEVHSGNGAQDREVTVVVEAAGQPQPQPQSQPNNKKPTPTPKFTFGGILKTSTDLAVVDIYPDSSGKILVSIQNAGTTDVKENIKMKCQGLFTTQKSQNQSYPLSNKSISVNLKPGQRGNYETGFARDPIYATMVVSCEMTPPSGDTNNANNALNNKQVK